MGVLRPLRRIAPPLSRQIHPLLALPALAKLLLVKKVGFWGAFAATKVYGWPNVTRRLLKFNKLHTPAPAQSTVQAGIIGMVRKPTEAYAILQDTQVYTFITVRGPTCRGSHIEPKCVCTHLHYLYVGTWARVFLVARSRVLAHGF